MGVADAVDSVLVRHKSGDNSTLGFKSYDQGREKWQGETLDVVWFDEEPPMDIYMEGLTRTNATGGMVYLTLRRCSACRTWFICSSRNAGWNDPLHHPHDDR